MIFVSAAFLLLAMPVGATLVNYDTAKASTRGGGGEQYENIPCSYLVPVPGDDIYTPILSSSSLFSYSFVTFKVFCFSFFILYALSASGHTPIRGPMAALWQTSSLVRYAL